MSIHARNAFKLLALAACAMGAWSAAQAADNTRYIGITGNNANACTLAAPCRTLQRGINATPAGGELRILDAGFYGNNAIVKRSLTISGNGNTIYLGTTLTIDMAGVVVTLRELTLDGQDTIVNGIDVVAAQAVHIKRCVIHSFTQVGIGATADGVEVFVTNSTVRDNGNAGLFVGFGDAMRLTIDNSHFDNNGVGVSVQAGHATIRGSTASGNGGNGIGNFGASVSILSTVAAQNGTGFRVSSGGTMTVESSVAHGNEDDGLVAQIGGIARISNSTFTGNATGIRNNASTVETRENNTVRGNTANVSGGLTLIGGV